MVEVDRNDPWAIVLLGQLREQIDFYASVAAAGHANGVSSGSVAGKVESAMRVAIEHLVADGIGEDPKAAGHG